MQIDENEETGRLEYIFSHDEEIRALASGLVTGNGIAFREDYYSDGCYFTLMRNQFHTDEQIKEAKQYLRDKRDVVGIAVGFVR